MELVGDYDMEIKEFYKELYSKLKDILKPYEFRKKGDRFRCLLDNGIAWEIEIQRNESKLAKIYSFTVNIHIGLFPVSKPIDVWKLKISQLSGNLGEKLDEQWNNQKWYDLSAMTNPQVKAQIRDGKRPLTYQEPGKEMQTIWVPCPTFDEIIVEISELVEKKFIPLYMSVQTLEDYIKLLEESKGFMASMSEENIKFYAEIFGKRFSPVLNKRIKDAENYLEYMLSQDMSKYEEYYRQFHEHAIEAQKGRIANLRAIENELQEKA